MPNTHHLKIKFADPYAIFTASLLFGFLLPFLPWIALDPQLNSIPFWKTITTTITGEHCFSLIDTETYPEQAYRQNLQLLGWLAFFLHVIIWCAFATIHFKDAPSQSRTNVIWLTLILFLSATILLILWGPDASCTFKSATNGQYSTTVTLFWPSLLGSVISLGLGIWAILIPIPKK